MLFVNSLYRPDPRGRLASSVFSSNQYGNYEKMFKAPKQPRTSAQLLVRALFTTISQLWDTLDAAHWTGWNTFASGYTFTKNNKTYKLSGFALFKKLNGNLGKIGQPFATTVPVVTIPAVIGPVSVAINTTPGTADITLTLATALSVNEIAVVTASPVIKPGCQPRLSNQRAIMTIDNTFITPGSIKTAYIAHFGAMPATGQRVQFTVRAYDITSGWAGPLYEATATGAL